LTGKTSLFTFGFTILVQYKDTVRKAVKMLSVFAINAILLI